MNNGEQFFNTTAGAGGYQIERSLRFNSADSAYLSRTPASAGNRKTWTWAGWFKASSSSTEDPQIFTSDTDINNRSGIVLDTSEGYRLSYYSRISGTTQAFVSTNALIRDYSAWYHFVITVDTTQSTSSDRVKIYINGVLQSLNAVTFPAQNYDTHTNLNAVHNIGRYPSFAGRLLDAYLADVHFIDGQALDPTSFGEFDDNGIWQPKAFSGGSYGTNGFHLPFSDNSTAAALGTDTSGNGNDWTVNNISVAAGAGNDSLVDSPTNGTQTDTGVGGEVVGNYATFNPLNNSTTLSNGNLQSDAPTNIWYSTVGTIYVSSGKWYWEITPTTLGLSMIGVANKSVNTASNASATDTANAYQYYSFSGNKFGPTNNNTAYGASYAANDVIGVALDMDAGTLTFYKNNVSQGVAYSGLTGIELAPFVAIHDYTSTGTLVANFGQRPFAYTAPSGFKALCTANLPAPTIEDGSTVMDVLTWTGTGSGVSSRSFTGLSFSPDLVWAKTRGGTPVNISHTLYDTVRGPATASVERMLSSNSTNSESVWDGYKYGYLSAFDPDGFTWNKGTLDPWYFNHLNASYVAWTWDAGSSTVTNNDGTISSQVRANASAGFSVVTFTGTGSTGTIGHGLGVAPSVYLVKKRSGTSNWAWFTTAIDGSVDFLFLNSTAAKTDAGGGYATAPTSSVFSLGDASSSINDNGGTYVAYCFAPVEGYSAFGSYTGNGSADGPFVYTGFRPRWIMTKDTTVAGAWLIHDTARDPYNVSNLELQANAATAEYNTVSAGAGNRYDILSNGFKHRTNNSGANASGSTYIYAAFAESPFQYARAR